MWRKPGLTYVPANQECRILAQVVEIPEMYKNISPLNLRLSYRWQWFGEHDRLMNGNASVGEHWNVMWRTDVKHSGNTVEHMNTGMEGLRTIGVTMSMSNHTGGDDDSTPEVTIIPGSYEFENITGDTMEISLTVIPMPEMFGIYTNRVISYTDNQAYERGCSTLTVFMEPY